MALTGEDICLIIIAIFLPPVTAFMTNQCDMFFWITVLLWLLGHFPGVIMAIYLVFRRSQLRGGVTAGTPAYGAAPARY